MKFRVFIIFVLTQMLLSSVLAASSCLEYLSESTSKQESHLVFVSSMNTKSIKKYMSFAVESFKRRQYDEVLDYIQPILNHDPNDIRALDMYARAQLALKNVVEAHTAIVKVLKQETVYRESSYLTYSQALIYQKKTQRAQQYLRLILERNPFNSYALGMLAQIYLSENRLSEARDLIARKGEINELDPVYKLLRFEYFYRVNQLERASGVANDILVSHRPKAKQTLVPRAYRKGLALRAKVLAKMNTNLQQAWDDILEYESYNKFLSNWVYILKAEIQFKMGRPEQSRVLLLDLVKNAETSDPMVVAALVYLDSKGHHLSMDQKIDDPLVDFVFSQLSPLDKLEVKKIVDRFDWDYVTSQGDLNEVSIFNYFWFGMDQAAVDSQTRRTTF